MFLYPNTPFAYLIGQLLAIAWDILQHNLVNQYRHGVKVAGKSVGADPQSLQRYRTATDEWVEHEWSGAGCTTQSHVSHHR